MNLAAHSTIECAQFWEAEWGGKAFFSHGSSNSKGIMILVNPNLELKVDKCITDRNERYILLDLIVDESHMILLNIYAPNDVNQQFSFFTNLQNLLAEFTQENIVVAETSTAP